MIQNIRGRIRRIANNPWRADNLNRGPGVIFYLEGEGTRYMVTEIREAFVEAVLLSKEGDLIEAELRKSDNPTDTGLLVAKWVNKTFDRDQAALTA